VTSWDLQHPERPVLCMWTSVIRIHLPGSQLSWNHFAAHRHCRMWVQAESRHMRHSWRTVRLDILLLGKNVLRDICYQSVDMW